MPPKGGSFILAAVAGQKKKVLSNKALTRRVRALTGKEGIKLTTGQNLFDNETLAANTAEIAYMTTLNSLDNHLIHTVRFFVTWQNITNSTNRIIVFEDTRPSQGNAVAADILVDATEVLSRYATAVHPFSAKRLDKNIGDTRRIRILKDIAWHEAEQLLNVDVISVRKFDINFGGRKLDAKLSWGVLINANQANSPIDIQYTAVITDLDS